MYSGSSSDSNLRISSAVQRKDVLDWVVMMARVCSLDVIDCATLTICIFGIWNGTSRGHYHFPWSWVSESLDPRTLCDGFHRGTLSRFEVNETPERSIVKPAQGQSALVIYSSVLHCLDEDMKTSSLFIDLQEQATISVISGHTARPSCLPTTLEGSKP